MAQAAPARDCAPVAFAPEAPLAERARPPRTAGWYPDPEARATVRFFDGDGWTEHTRGPAPLRSIASRTRPVQPAETRCYASFTNRRASAALAVGAISVLLNPLLLTSAVGIVLGIGGLRRSRSSLGRTGRGKAAAGLGLALTGIMTSALLAAVAIPLFLHAQQGARMAAVQAAISDDAANRGVQLVSLRCPPDPPQPGDGFECRAATPQHDRIRIEVLVPADGGRVQVAEHAAPVPARKRHR